MTITFVASRYNLITNLCICVMVNEGCICQNRCSFIKSYMSVKGRRGNPGNHQNMSSYSDYCAVQTYAHITIA